MSSDIFYVERYRPKTIKDCVLPKELEETFLKMVEGGKIPSLMLHGSQGTGKTTVARALANQLDYDLLFINGSDEGRYLDTLRNKIKQFATSVSFDGKRKVVLIDEFDNTTGDVQTAMRGIMEAVSNNCSFILTCNFPNKIIDAIKSRCSVIEFKIPQDEKQTIAIRFFKRVCEILNENGVTYDKPAIAELVKLYMPDWRRILNEVQRYSARGHIDEGILKAIGSVEVTELVQFLKGKDFKSVRLWVGQNPQTSISQIGRQIYDNIYSMCEPNSIPRAIIILADYQFKEATVADREINTMACMIELMSEVTWK